jgi:hypothetical protein
MILISHRGNINGKDPDKENNPDYIISAISKGFEVEVDVWYDEGFYLGHDGPEYKVDTQFLDFYSDKLWCHAKNIEAVVEMRTNSKIHYFWHQEDDITLTSQGYIWAYPGKQPIKGSIAVMPYIYGDDVSKCIGVCSDYIEKFNLITK